MPEHNVMLEIVCGNDAEVPVQLYDGDSGSTPLNLTGVTEIKYVAKKQAGEDYPALLTLTYTASGGITITGLATAGLIKLTFAATKTLPLVGTRLLGPYAHELQVTDATGKRSTVFTGDLRVRATAVA